DRRARARGDRAHSCGARHDDGAHHAQLGDLEHGRSRALDARWADPRRNPQPGAPQSARAVVVASALDKKLIRDLWRMRGQVLAIGLIMASGIGILIMGLATVESLDETARAYYERYRFGHVFARVKRAPERLAAQVGALPGVRTVEPRVVANAVLDIAGFEEPVVAELVSLPTHREAKLNLVAVRSGRMPRPRSTDEALVSEPFAEAHGLQVGDRIRAILNGSWRELRIVGVALSPEYVYAIGPGALMPDDARFGVLCLDE